MKDKPRRGRPKGATSFARVSLQDLIDHLGHNASVVVGKKWLDEIGLTLEAPVVSSRSIKTVADEPKEEEKIAFSISSPE